uniref:Uncharacterized protein n=2 Tax=Oryza TaxID=4527 RepID=A0A0D9ZV30_9ORYZ
MAAAECEDESPESAMVASGDVGSGPTVGHSGVEHAQERLILVQQQPAGILSPLSSGTALLEATESIDGDESHAQFQCAVSRCKI